PHHRAASLVYFLHDYFLSCNFFSYNFLINDLLPHCPFSSALLLSSLFPFPFPFSLFLRGERQEILPPGSPALWTIGDNH
ncbi:MAG: hypothetical protein ACKOB4_11275, partial [Acidobacteriota bacterium]